MVKLIIGATVALLGVAVGAVLGVIVDAPTWLAVAAAVLTSVSVPLGAGDALARLVASLPDAVLREVALYVGVVVATLEAINATVVDTELWVHIVLGVLIALSGALGIRLQATPITNPRAGDGTPLVPVDAVEPGMPLQADALAPHADRPGRIRPLVAEAGHVRP